MNKFINWMYFHQVRHAMDHGFSNCLFLPVLFCFGKGGWRKYSFIWQKVAKTLGNNLFDFLWKAVIRIYLAGLTQNSEHTRRKKKDRASLKLNRDTHSTPWLLKVFFIILLLLFHTFAEIVLKRFFSYWLVYPMVMINLKRAQLCVAVRYL